MVWEGGKCCGRVENVVGGWKMLWEAGKCCGRVANFVGGWKMLWEAGKKTLCMLILVVFTFHAILYN